jgi:outer membrane protein assembly factor BamE (lipoprotein component of BamABCDE complex)
MEEGMRIIGFLVTLLIVVGCASHGKLVTRDQASWIQKGVTTRDEVVKRLGSPNFPEVPSASTMFSTEYETTTEETVENGKKVTRGTMKVIPAKGRRTIAQYFYAQSAAFAGTTTKDFWIGYDEQGTVQNFGFSDTAISSCP